MAKSKNLSHGNIKVTLDEDGIDVTSEAVPDAPASRTFTILKTLGNIFFFTAGTDHQQKANQKDKFKNKVTLEVPLDEDVINHPTAKSKGKKALSVVYYDKSQGEWVAFKNQKLDENSNVATITFNEWIKDPPIGWGSPN